MNEAAQVKIDMMLTEIKAARVRNDLDAALHSLQTAEAALEPHQGSDADKRRSRLYYERAYVFRWQEAYESAVAAFRTSAEFSRKAGDELRELFSELNAQRTSFLADALEPQAAYDGLIALKEKHAGISSLPKADEEFWRGCEHDILTMLADVAYEADRPDASSWADLSRNHQRMLQNRGQRFHNFDEMDAWMQGIIHMQSQEYREAAQLYSSFLPVSVPTFGTIPPKLLSEQLDFKIHMVAWKEEVARYYRELGKALVRTRVREREKWARLAWTMGLNLGTANSNKRFNRQIRELLQSV